MAAITATISLVVLVIAVLALLPVSLASILEDVLGAADSKVFRITTGPPASAAPASGGEQIALDVAIVQVDELTRLATLRVSGHRTCPGGCGALDRISLYSLPLDDEERVGAPPLAQIQITDGQTTVMQSVQLPIDGHPIRYPFDHYALRLAIDHERHAAAGVGAAPAATAHPRLVMTLQEQLPRLIISPPVQLDPARFRPPGVDDDYLAVLEMRFTRPLYLHALAVLLVLLIAAAAAYMVFIRPLHDFFINFGGIVVGIWGVRSILVPASASYVTAVDLALSVVIMFLLGSITFRALISVHPHSGLPPRRPPRPPAATR